MDRRLAASSVGHPESDSRKVCPGRSSGTRIIGNSRIVLSRPRLRRRHRLRRFRRYCLRWCRHHRHPPRRSCQMSP
jgi:hypothetical protein